MSTITRNRKTWRVAMVTPALCVLSWAAFAADQPAAGLDLKGVIAGATPSVVRVYGESASRLAPGQVQVVRQASGVVLSADGFVVTQNGVIVDPARVFIRTADEVRIPAKVVLRDADTDLAYLKVEHPGLKPIIMGRVDQVSPGQAVLHIGNPFGLALGKKDELSVNHGVVNSIHPLDPSGRGYKGNIIQTDAGFNPGGYGGALVNLKGELIGVAAAIVTSRRTNTEISFAIPVDEVEHQLERARQELGNPTQPVTPPAPEPAGQPAPKPVQPEPTPQPPTPAQAPGYLGAYILEETSGTRGAYIDKVVPGSPAETAGLKGGDLVTAADAQSLKNGGELMNVLDKAGEGQTLKLTVERQGVRFEIEVKLGKVPGRVLR